MRRSKGTVLPPAVTLKPVTVKPVTLKPVTLKPVTLKPVTLTLTPVTLKPVTPTAAHNQLNVSNGMLKKKRERQHRPDQRNNNQ
ncbi:hypothetical protein D9C73_012138 [Collichthys lucidus]|uniref:Uncharacterized protein n=1 Tax=Collichthys lucidus TaxID=240159 RepID=A0A4U5UUY7_COLLU|nr:hypothetical protein D9C73_012138 [Collichthys lucidus]